MSIRKLFVAKNGERIHPVKSSLNFILVCIVLIALFWVSLGKLGVTFDFSFIGVYQDRIVQGLMMTIALSVLSLILSLIVGVASAVGRGSKVLFIRYLCDVYVKFIRGTPLIMQIYLFFYIIGTAWGIDNRFVVGVLILSLFEGAYISEIIRGSLLSIEESQLEAAKAVGFTKKQTIKLVILPQLIARTLPALTGQFASIIKDSSLLSIIAVIELTQAMREISATTFQLFESYLFLGMLYLLLTLPITFISEALERRFKYER